MNFETIDSNGTVEGFAICKSCERKNSKNGTYFLDMTLADKSGEINAKLWNHMDGMDIPEPNSLIKVRGTISVFNGQPQIKIDRIRKVWDSDRVDMADFVPSADYDGKYMLGELENIVDNFEDKDLKMIVGEALQEYGEEMVICPAAFKLHHAIRGGLLMHTLSIVRLAQNVCDIYPSVDRELLLAGAIMHDICKTQEFKLSPLGLAEGYSVDGTLLGHLVMGAMLIDRIADAVGANHDTAVLLEHMLISHHGVPEFGAAVRPLFLEAEVLSQLDDLDAKIYEVERAVGDIKPGEFSARQWALDDRKFYNHGRMKIEPKAVLDKDNHTKRTIKRAKMKK